MNQTENKIDNAGNSRPPFLVRKRTTFTWVVPILLLIATLSLHRNYFGFAGYAAGIVLVILGEIVRFWAAGYISKDAVIASGGPYAFVRNPLYFGSLLLSIGYGLVSGLGIAGVIVMVAFYLLFHLAAIFYEEGFLKAKFGQPYLDYYNRVPRLIPALTPRTTGEGQYEWKQALYNREQTSALFAFILVALLSLRYFVK
jgi:protein-S-isoprenylcysteine O-methyltransferase Ste14